jgi:hypothetical protein
MAKKRKAKARKAAKKPRKATKRRKATSRLERELEEGLRETFPASDPPALTDPVRTIKE